MNFFPPLARLASQFGTTPLFNASSSYHAEVADLLVAARAVVNVTDEVTLFLPKITTTLPSPAATYLSCLARFRLVASLVLLSFCSALETAFHGSSGSIWIASKIRTQAGSSCTQLLDLWWVQLFVVSWRHPRAQCRAGAVPWVGWRSRGPAMVRTSLRQVAVASSRAAHLDEKKKLGASLGSLAVGGSVGGAWRQG